MERMKVEHILDFISSKPLIKNNVLKKASGRELFFVARVLVQRVWAVVFFGLFIGSFRPPASVIPCPSHSELVSESFTCTFVLPKDPEINSG